MDIVAEVRLTLEADRSTLHACAAVLRFLGDLVCLTDFPGPRGSVRIIKHEPHAIPERREEMKKGSLQLPPERPAIA